MKIKNMPGLLAGLLVAIIVAACATVTIGTDPLDYARIKNTAMKYVHENIAPSVVTIYSMPTIVIVSKAKLEKAKGNGDVDAIVYPCVKTAKTGAGVVVREDGMTVTAAHVTDVSDLFDREECYPATEKAFKAKGEFDKFQFFKVAQYKVKDLHGDTWSARLVASEPFTDIAVIKIDTPFKWKPIPFSKEQDFSYQAIAVIGAPGGWPDMLTTGNVAREERHKGIHVIIAAPIYPGNSGGVSINLADMGLMGIVDEVFMVEGRQMMSYGCVISGTLVQSFIQDALAAFDKEAKKKK